MKTETAFDYSGLAGDTCHHGVGQRSAARPYRSMSCVLTPCSFSVTFRTLFCEAGRTTCLSAYRIEWRRGVVDRRT